MDKIIDGLFIGNIRDARDQKQLKAHSISHILSIHDTAKCGQIEGIKYLCISIADSPHQNIIKYIPKCNDFIHQARLSGGKVLIHCLAGMSRSVTIVAAYLISVTTLNSNEALDAIRTVRSISAPNPGFYKQLLDFEMYRLKQERNRITLEKQFVLNPNDEIELRKLLVAGSEPILSIRYEPNWKSLDARPLPKWYDQSKIGIFIHFGLFSVPSYVSEWFWNFWIDQKTPYLFQHISIDQYMKKNFKPNFTYAEFGVDFTAKLFNASHWADIIKKSGAKYAVLTTKHHEGFTLWPSKYSFNWNSMDVGPKRDIVGEFSKAVQNLGIHHGLYYSLFEWFHPLYLKDKEHNYTTKDYVHLKVRPELEELINTYKPYLLWSDGDAVFNDTYWNSTDILAWLYNDSPVKDIIVTNDRWGTNCHNKHGGFFDGPDRNNPKTMPKHKWESAISIDQNAWGYRRNVSLNQLLTIEQLIQKLLKTISFGGNLLINVGPTKDGRIMPIFEERLLQLGDWLKMNGEAIYESHVYEKCQISKNNKTFYTTKNDSIYGITLNWSEKGTLEFECIDYYSVSRVTMLGINQNIKFYQGPNGTIVRFPRWIPKLKYAFSFKFHLI